MNICLKTTDKGRKVEEHASKKLIAGESFRNTPSHHISMIQQRKHKMLPVSNEKEKGYRYLNNRITH